MANFFIAAKNFLMKTPYGKTFNFMTNVPNTFSAARKSGTVYAGVKAVAKDFHKTFDGTFSSIFTLAGGVSGAIIPIPGMFSLGATAGYYTAKGIKKVANSIFK